VVVGWVGFGEWEEEEGKQQENGRRESSRGKKKGREYTWPEHRHKNSKKIYSIICLGYTT
jgi:hypothetical protein